MKKLLVAISVLLILFVGVRFVLSSPFYKITTPITKGLFLVKIRARDNKPITSNSSTGSGICAPPGCGNPAGTRGEDVTLALTAEQLTSLINQYSPSSVPLKNARVSISGQVIYAAAESTYAILPGQISASARLDLNHFYVKDVYVGGIKAPQKVANFVEANLAGLIDNAFSKYSAKILEMRLENEKLFIKVNAPKGTVMINNDGTVTLNLVEAPSGNMDSSYSDPNNRF